MADLVRSVGASDADRIADQLVARFGGLPAVLSAGAGIIEDLCPAHGAELHARLTLTRRLLLEASAPQPDDGALIDGLAALQNYLALDVGWSSVEQVRLLLLSADRRVLSDVRVGCGGLRCVEIPVRAIVHLALDRCAHSIVIAHNHPSGDPTPSRADLDMTKRLSEALMAIEVRLHDHLIVTRRGSSSLRELGYL